MKKSGTYTIIFTLIILSTYTQTISCSKRSQYTPKEDISISSSPNPLSPRESTYTNFLLFLQKTKDIYLLISGVLRSVFSSVSDSYCYKAATCIQQLEIPINVLIDLVTWSMEGMEPQAIDMLKLIRDLFTLYVDEGNDCPGIGGCWREILDIFVRFSADFKTFVFHLGANLLVNGYDGYNRVLSLIDYYEHGLVMSNYDLGVNFGTIFYYIFLDDNYEGDQWKNILSAN